MAEHYFLPRRFVKRYPWAHRAGQRAEAAFIAAALGLLRRLPLGTSTRLASRLFAIIGPWTGAAGKIEHNLCMAFPHLDERERKRLGRRIFGNFGVAVAELTQLDRIWAQRDRRIEFASDFNFEQGRPAVFVAAHIGPWTFANFLAGYYAGLAITTLYAPESNPHVHDRIRALRAALPCRFIPRDNSMRELVKELGAGRAVGLGSDVRFDAGPALPFFGLPMHTNTVPAKLALRFDCELIPVRTERLPGGRFRIAVHAPVRPRDPHAAKDEQTLDMSTQLNALFEQWIREDPTQWMCLSRRWSKKMPRACDRTPPSQTGAHPCRRPGTQ